MGWWKTAKPGDFVVCVKSVPSPRDGKSPLVKGVVYEIKNTFVAPLNDPCAGEVGLRLKGMNNGWRRGMECGWGYDYFRPVKPLHTTLIDYLRAPTKERV